MKGMYTTSRMDVKMRSLYNKLNLINFYFNNNIYYRKISCKEDACELLNAIETQDPVIIIKSLREKYKSEAEKFIEAASIEMRNVIYQSYMNYQFETADRKSIEAMANMMNVQLNKNLSDCECRVELLETINGMATIRAIVKKESFIDEIQIECRLIT